MARYDRGYDYGLRGYDQAYGRYGAGGAGNVVRGGYGPGAGGYPAMRGRAYDRDMDRGYRAEHQRRMGGGYPAGRQNPGLGGGGGYPAGGGSYQGGGYQGAGREYDYGFRGEGALPNRVTRSYNADYVNPRPDERTFNYAPYGGDVEGRVGDGAEYQRPYITRSGTRTWRGGSRPVGWENAYNRGERPGGWGGPGW
jgi:hypothetical protein